MIRFEMTDAITVNYEIYALKANTHPMRKLHLEPCCRNFHRKKFMSSGNSGLYLLFTSSKINELNTLLY